MGNVIEIKCVCGTTFTYNHGDTATGERLADAFIYAHAKHNNILIAKETATGE